MKKAIYWLTLLVGWALLPLAIIWVALKIGKRLAASQDELKFVYRLTTEGLSMILSLTLFFKGERNA